MPPLSRILSSVLRQDCSGAFIPQAQVYESSHHDGGDAYPLSGTNRGAHAATRQGLADVPDLGVACACVRFSDL